MQVICAVNRSCARAMTQNTHLFFLQNWEQSVQQTVSPGDVVTSRVVWNAMRGVYDMYIAANGGVPIHSVRSKAESSSEVYTDVYFVVEVCPAGGGGGRSLWCGAKTTCKHYPIPKKTSFPTPSCVCRSSLPPAPRTLLMVSSFSRISQSRGPELLSQTRLGRYVLNIIALVE